MLIDDPKATLSSGYVATSRGSPAATPCFMYLPQLRRKAGVALIDRYRRHVLSGFRAPEPFAPTGVYPLFKGEPQSAGAGTSRSQPTY
jgi:hypothetical protein